LFIRVSSLCPKADQHGYFTIKSEQTNDPL